MVLAVCGSVGLRSVSVTAFSRRNPNFVSLLSFPLQNDFNQRVRLAGNKLIVADFMADWCGPCRQIAPKLQDLENRYGNRMSVLKVNVDQCSNLAHHYHVSSMPTFVFIKNGREVDRFSGADAKQLQDKIQRYS